ncbi:MAG: glycosyltransferase 87 family protein [Terracidiphilus sp.]
MNTDFPNYYLTARLAHEGYDTTRMYEWEWIQREKDHRAIDNRTVGLVPQTPFSLLVMWPLTGLTPLAAKHIWILLNLGFLVPIGWMLRSMTGLSYRRIALAFALSFPLHRNFSLGQFYVFLLLLIVTACWAYLRGYHALAGALVAIAAACKIFPLALFVFFLQRRDWRALASGAVTLLATVGVSIAIFGWNLNRTYLREILPWGLHGEAMPSYAVNASISELLHHLFLSEPQWNPHPWHDSPLCYALLLPVLQMLVLAPAILLIRRGVEDQGRMLLEWSALLTALLTVSTEPAFYNFVLMVMPVCVVAMVLLQRKRYGWLIGLLLVYLGIGSPISAQDFTTGPAVLLHVLRLPCMFALLLGMYALLWSDPLAKRAPRDWTRFAWAAAMFILVVSSATSTFRRESAVRQEYAYRLPQQSPSFLNAAPQAAGSTIRYVAFTFAGYQLLAQDQNGISPQPSFDPLSDDLSFTSGFGQVLVERPSSPKSQIVNVQNPGQTVVEDARDPVLSTDGKHLAFVRDIRGSGRLMVRTGLLSDPTFESALTPTTLNVYEASFLSEEDFAFSAVEEGRSPRIYLSDATNSNTRLVLGESRYPALSPDGRWMAYSHLDGGYWNLWLRDQSTGTRKRIADVPCNQIQSAWQDDSKTLLYTTDCGRSLWFAAVARRKVIP